MTIVDHARGMPYLQISREASSRQTIEVATHDNRSIALYEGLCRLIAERWNPLPAIPSERLWHPSCPTLDTRQDFEHFTKPLLGLWCCSPRKTLQGIVSESERSCKRCFRHPEKLGDTVDVYQSIAREILTSDQQSGIDGSARPQSLCTAFVVNCLTFFDRCLRADVASPELSRFRCAQLASALRTALADLVARNLALRHLTPICRISPTL